MYLCGDVILHCGKVEIATEIPLAKPGAVCYTVHISFRIAPRGDSITFTKCLKDSPSGTFLHIWSYGSSYSLLRGAARRTRSHTYTKRKGYVMYKKELRITGTPVGRLTPGARALIIEDSFARLTSTVLAVEENSPFELRFETRNTLYTLSIPVRSAPPGTDTISFAPYMAERE